MFLLLIIFTNLGTLIADDVMSDENLQCFNDKDKSMVCHFTTDKSKCAEYNMTLKLLDPQKKVWNDCTFKEKERSNGVSKCGCYIHPMVLVIGEEFNATLWNSGKRLNSKVISIKSSIKPKTPTVQEVKPTENGNFLVKWKTNYPDDALFPKYLIAELSYRKKGETDEVSKNDSTTSHEILGRDLEPNTIYALKVRTYTDFSGRFSDWSEELEFTNPASSQKVLQIVIVLSCITIIIITSALFWCSVRLKTKLWDNIPKCSNSELLYMVPGIHKILSPPKILLSPIYVDSSKMDIEGKTWTNLSIGDGSSGRGQQQGNGSELDSSSSLGYAHTCSLFLGTGQQDLNLSTNCAPLLQTDFSYHPCDGASDDSETTTSAEDTSLIYGSNDSNVTSVVAGYQSFSEAVACQTLDAASPRVTAIIRLYRAWDKIAQISGFQGRVLNKTNC
ncbi:hypothetical protein J4Q44_G00173180 [Coregonus suidteri]|uniref:Fibronectin type-III domain-containing protein n=1 Tax=Coregonus suidteri TaxID=861788 RepID=A0AAN8LKX5_9TELE